MASWALSRPAWRIPSEKARVWSQRRTVLSDAPAAVAASLTDPERSKATKATCCRGCKIPDVASVVIDGHLPRRGGAHPTRRWSPDRAGGRSWAHLTRGARFCTRWRRSHLGDVAAAEAEMTLTPDFEQVDTVVVGVEQTCRSQGDERLQSSRTFRRVLAVQAGGRGCAGEDRRPELVDLGAHPSQLVTSFISSASRA